MLRSMHLVNNNIREKLSYLNKYNILNIKQINDFYKII